MGTLAEINCIADTDSALNSNEFPLHWIQTSGTKRIDSVTISATKVPPVKKTLLTCFLVPGVCSWLLQENSGMHYRKYLLGINLSS